MVVTFSTTQLRWDSPSNLQVLSLTCRGFRRLALPVLFDTLQVRFRPKPDMGRQLLQDLHGAGYELFHCVRILTVSGYYNPEEDIPSPLAPLLVSLVDKLPRLVVFRYSLGDIPETSPTTDEKIDGAAASPFLMGCCST